MLERPPHRSLEHLQPAGETTLESNHSCIRLETLVYEEVFNRWTVSKEWNRSRYCSSSRIIRNRAPSLERPDLNNRA